MAGLELPSEVDCDDMGKILWEMDVTTKELNTVGSIVYDGPELPIRSTQESVVLPEKEEGVKEEPKTVEAADKSENQDIESIATVGQNKVNDVIMVTRESVSEKEEKKCSICSKDFQSNISLKYHKRESHNISADGEVETPCPYCSKQYWSNQHRLLKRHIELFHSLKKKTFPPIEGKTCPVCFKTFYNKTNVKRHLLTEHERSLRISCPECEKTFASKSALDYHVKVHSSQTEVNCDECKESFPDFRSLNSHKIKHHRPSNEKKCADCGVVLKGKSSLNRHMMEVHDVTRYDTKKIDVFVFSHKCDQCDFKSKRIDHLKDHIAQKHSKEKEMFPCGSCEKVFSYKKTLRRHQKFCKSIEKDAL